MKDLLLKKLPHQKQKQFFKKGLTYNIMVVGAHGVGKTSLINTLLGFEMLPNNPKSYKHQQNIKEIQIRSSSAPYKIIARPEEIKSGSYRKAIIDFKITEAVISSNSDRMNLSVVEIDGVGDAINNLGCWGPIKAFLTENYEDFYAQENTKGRSYIRDKRIHVCLYFINSKSIPLKEVDIKVMKEISSLVNIIPIFTSYDINGAYDINPILNTINEFLLAEDINIMKINNCKSKYRRNHLIFNIRNEMKNQTQIDKTIEDLKLLKSVLLDRNMIDLIESTNDLYEVFKISKLEKIFDSDKCEDEEIIDLLNKVVIDQEKTDAEYNEKLNYLMEMRRMLEKK